MKKYVRRALVANHQRKVALAAKRKLKLISKHINEVNLSSEVVRKYKAIWKSFKNNPSLLFLKCVSNISGIHSCYYIPEDIHYNYIEPVLNSRPYALAYNDKNLFETLLPNYRHLFPHALLRGVNGVNYDREYISLSDVRVLGILKSLDNHNNFVLKPGVETGGGENVLVLEKTTTGFRVNQQYSISFSDLLNILKINYAGNFILQSRITQHAYFQDFNPSSLNTVRLYTYRSVNNESIIPLHAYIRFGKSGSFVDSSSQGGRTCGVFMDGLLNSFAIGKYGEKYRDINWINRNKGKPIPRFDVMKQLAAEIAPIFRHHRLLGFDFSVDMNEEVRLLEVNNLYIGVINQQMNTGPLFGELTEEVVDFCLKNKKSYNNHFYL
jgi:hypothetical protein